MTLGVTFVLILKRRVVDIGLKGFGLARLEE